MSDRELADGERSPRRPRWHHYAAAAIVLAGVGSISLIAVARIGEESEDGAPSAPRTSPASPPATGRPPAAQPTPIVGVNLHAGWSDVSRQENEAIIDLLAEAGVRWLRVDIGWCTIEEAGPGAIDPVYVVQLDHAIDHAARRDLRVLGMLWCTPAWASGATEPGAPPDDVETFAHFAEQAATYWRGRVHAWQIWNEPDPLQPFWLGTQADYVDLLAAAAPRVRAADPDARVVVAGPSSNDHRWVEQLYRLGAADHFDVLSTHTYQERADAPPEAQETDGTSWLANLSEVRAAMERHGDLDTPIWVTEFGWSTHENVDGLAPWQRGVSEREQAQYLVRTLELLDDDHPYVELAFWYNARDRIDADLHENHFGLLRRDLSAKPALEALGRHLGVSRQVPR